jgi:hypothetical protein
MKKVYFNHIPWNIHPVYQEMLDNPPEWIEYINKSNFWKNYQNTAIANKTQLNFSIKFKNNIIIFLKKIYFLPNITFRKLPWDIIYSCQSIPLFWNYILDLDCYESLNRFSNRISENYLNKILVKYFLKQKRCKKIVFWSESAKKSFQSYLWSEFDYKLEVLYPWINSEINIDLLLSKKDKKEILITCIWKDFIYKSIIEILDASNIIISKYPQVKFLIIWQVDESIRNNYINKNIIFLWLLPRNQTIEILKKSHIFLLPTFIDIFWFTFLEAFSYWLFCIAGEGYATKEIVSSWEDGIIIQWYKVKNYDENTKKKKNISLEHLKEFKSYQEKIKVVNEIVSAIIFFINNKSDSQIYLFNWFKKVNEWIFSIKNRNKKLKDIIIN